MINQSEFDILSFEHSKQFLTTVIQLHTDVLEWVLAIEELWALKIAQ